MRAAMEAGISVSWDRGSSNAGHFSSPTTLIAASCSSSLSFWNSFQNPLIYTVPVKPCSDHGKQPNALITSRVEWAKDKSLDDVVQRHKRLKLVTKLRDLLVKEPGMCMSLRELGRQRRKLGLAESRRLVVLLRRYPAVFELFEEGVSNLYFRLAPPAEEIFLEEQKLKAEMESTLVCKVRKLLMMSIDKTLLLYNISHIRRDLGLPDDFRQNFVEKYPDFFKVVELKGGPALELTSWDADLAISAWERNVERGTMNTEITVNPKIRRLKKGQRNLPPKTYQLKRKDIESIRRFHEMTYFSPYAEFAHLDPASHEAERHACAVVHEILSLTLEKRLNVDYLTHFRRDFKFSQQLYGMLVRHPELFYVSRKGDRDCVFLREAYQGSQLVMKDPLIQLKEKLRALLEEGDKALDGVEKKDDSMDEGNLYDEDFNDDDLSAHESSGDDLDEEMADKYSTVALNSKARTPRRPLIVLQREREIAEAAAFAERW